jgi:predicted secreted protein
MQEFLHLGELSADLRALAITHPSSTYRSKHLHPSEKEAALEHGRGKTVEGFNNGYAVSKTHRTNLGK